MRPTPTPDVGRLPHSIAHRDRGLETTHECSTVAELLEMAGEALKMPIPSIDERAVVRDKKEEMTDWLELIADLVG